MTLGPCRHLALTLPALASALMMLASTARAQTTEAPKAEGLERAQKAADAVFHWIRVNGEKGATRQPAPAPAPAAAAPAPAPATAAAPAARKPAQAAAPAAPAPRPAAVAQTNTPAPAKAESPAPAPAPAAAPVVAVTAPEPEPDRSPVVLAAAEPTPAPAAPLSAAARAVQPPPQPVAEVETPLKLLAKVEPIIPRQLMQNFRGGFAQVQFTVEADGKVSQAQAIKSSNSRLGVAAVEAVKQWRFAPIGKAREAAVEVAFNSTEN